MTSLIVESLSWVSFSKIRSPRGRPNILAMTLSLRTASRRDSDHAVLFDPSTPVPPESFIVRVAMALSSTSSILMSTMWVLRDFWGFLNTMTSFDFVQELKPPSASPALPGLLPQIGPRSRNREFWLRCRPCLNLSTTGCPLPKVTVLWTAPPHHQLQFP